MLMQRTMAAQQLANARRPAVVPGVQLSPSPRALCGPRQAALSAGTCTGLTSSLRLPTRFTKGSVRCQAAEKPDTQATTNNSQETDNTQLLVSLGLGAIWIGLLAYVFFLSPNQTPYRDQIFVERILGIGEKDGFVVNPVFVGLFNLMGIYPAIYACLLVPAGRSENKVPAWPFITVSFFLGAYALLPYMVLWRPKVDNQVPPPKEELDGWNKLFMKGAETPILPGVLMLGALYYSFLALSSGGEIWEDYLKLFDESRLVHATTLDFATCTLLAPFWMQNDAQLRNWEQRDKLLPVLSWIPVIGPLVYLIMRPKTKKD